MQGFHNTDTETKKPNANLYHDTKIVNIKRSRSILWSVYDKNSKSLIGIENNTFTGFFVAHKTKKNVSSYLSSHSLLLNSDSDVYEFTYLFNIQEKSRQTNLGKFHTQLKKLIYDDEVTIWLSALGEHGTKIGVTVNNNKLAFDI